MKAQIYDACVAIDGDKRIVYTVSLDWDQLKAQAIKAANSKRGRSSDGAITVRVIGVRQIKEGK